jgi:nucleoside-diphosphate-sugar epimerase
VAGFIGSHPVAEGNDVLRVDNFYTGTRQNIEDLLGSARFEVLPNDWRVVSNLIMQTLRGEPITIYGNGTQTRSFCHVSDIVAPGSVARTSRRRASGLAGTRRFPSTKGSCPRSTTSGAS